MYIAEEIQQKLINANKKLKKTTLLNTKENNITAKIRIFFVHCFGLQDFSNARLINLILKSLFVFSKFKIF